MKNNDYDITLIVTQRCNAKCMMCNSHENPTRPEDEMGPEVMEKLPEAKFIQITGGEPFLRKDIEDIVRILIKKAGRVMINTNGYYTEKITELCRNYPQLAMRVSIDGSREMHDQIRGIPIYDKAMETIRELKEIGVKDLGISFTLQESNYKEMIPLYRKAVDLGVDFGVSVVHNSFYFSKDDNEIHNLKNLEDALRSLVELQIDSKRRKDWARAFFNDMSIRYLYQKPLPIHCDAGSSSFVIDAYGTVLPCNMTSKPWEMGSLVNSSWEEIMNGDQARGVMRRCRECGINCWSVCNVQSALKKKIWIPGLWLVREKAGHILKMRHGG
ncbi:MAG: radical SAM protein [Kineothrix sp.]|nr:radical SAM protein [Kineothrix sp.]